MFLRLPFCLTAHPQHFGVVVSVPSAVFSSPKCRLLTSPLPCSSIAEKVTKVIDNGSEDEMRR